MNIRLLVLGLLATSYSYADYTVDYRLSGTSTDSRDTFSSPYDFSTYYLDETDTKIARSEFDIYFGRVRTKDKPLAEAGFLSKLSKFSLSTDSSKTSTDLFLISPSIEETIEFPIRSEEFESTTLDTNLEIVTKGFPFILGFGATLGTSDIEVRNFNTITDNESEEVSWRLKMGLYYSGNGRLTYSYESSEIEYDDIFTDIDSTSHALNAKHVFQLSKNQFLSTYAHYNIRTITRNNSEFGTKKIDAGLTYYPTKQLGIGASWLEIDSGDPFFRDRAGYGLEIEYFFNDFVGVLLSYKNTSAGDWVFDDYIPEIDNQVIYEHDSEKIEATLNIRF